MEEHLVTSSPAGFRLRRLQAEDYSKGYCQLLSVLTQVGEIPEPAFQTTLQRIDSQPDTYNILVLEEEETGALAATGTLLIEQKFVHNTGKVGHVEDIVVSPDFQRRGLGKKMIEALLEIARGRGCYKVILDCSEEVLAFYEKCGLARRGVLMAHYFS
jgi:glucosamine-phosphate N-acetyltransferase